jgi:hypothetical protein
MERLASGRGFNTTGSRGFMFDIEVGSCPLDLTAVVVQLTAPPTAVGTPLDLSVLVYVVEGGCAAHKGRPADWRAVGGGQMMEARDPTRVALWEAVRVGARDRLGVYLYTPNSKCRIGFHNGDCTAVQGKGLALLMGTWTKSAVPFENVGTQDFFFVGSVEYALLPPPAGARLCLTHMDSAWRCAKCTFENAGLVATCEMCEATRPSEQMQARAPPVAPPASLNNRTPTGIGAEIVPISSGPSWGVAVGERHGVWELEGGRVAKKATEGSKWRWKPCQQAGGYWGPKEGGGVPPSASVSRGGTQAALTDHKPPACWSMDDFQDKARCIEITSENPGLRSHSTWQGAMQDAFNRTMPISRTALGGGRARYSDLRVTSVVRIESPGLWKRYVGQRDLMASQLRQQRVGRVSCETTFLEPPTHPGCDRGLNEVFLYHGLPAEFLDTITNFGFDERVGSLCGMFGAGTSYLFCRSDFKI